MTRRLAGLPWPAGLLFLATQLLFSQSSVPTGETRGSQPLYRVTNVSRTTKAVNYGHLSEPTSIEFRGTPLDEGARGHARIESRRGATLVDAKFSHLGAPTRFGAQYLTYVVWAISPEGRAQNLGELQRDGSDRARLKTATSLQTFALIVTAEPYYSVAGPSDAVVMENQPGPSTVGRVEEVSLSGDLLPRRNFSYEQPAESGAGGRLLSRNEHDALVAIDQARNAVRIAESQGGQRYAPDRLARARQLLEQARRYPTSSSREAVTLAREATQLAEDTRLIAARRAQDDRNRQLREQALRAWAVSRTERAAVESRPATVLPAAPPPPAAPPSPPPAVSTPPPAAPPAWTERQPEPVEVAPRQVIRRDPRSQENRRRVLAASSDLFAARDTARGIVLTLSETQADNYGLAARFGQLAAALGRYRELHISVEGHTDRAGESAMLETRRRAESVRQALIAAGLPGHLIAARGLGNTRPVVSNASASERGRNRRVEIVIAGDAIGDLATWDRTYTVTLPR